MKLFGTACKVLFLSTLLAGFADSLVQLAPSTDFLRIGCYSNSTNTLTATVQNSTLRSCLQACADKLVPLAFYNDLQCTCIKNDIIPASHVTTCQPSSDFQVFNTSMLFAVYGEVMEPTVFKVPGLNANQEISIHIKFGDESDESMFSVQSNITHRYLKEGRFTVSGFTNQSNLTSQLVNRDVIIQKRIPEVRMLCSDYVSTSKQAECSLDDLDGSGIKVDIDVLKDGNVTKQVNYTIPDRKRTSIGYLTPLSTSNSPNNYTNGTFIMAGLSFNDVLIVESWEIVANKPCTLKLQIFRPRISFQCNKPCYSSSNCKAWSYRTDNRIDCNTPCLTTRQCIRNTTSPCWIVEPAFQSLSSFSVQIQKGYNFIPVPQAVRSITTDYGDVIGWSTEETDCIKTLDQSIVSATLFSPNRSSSSVFNNNGAVLLKNITFAVRAHGRTPFSYKWTFCNKAVGFNSIRAKLSNRLDTRTTNDELIIFQNPLEGLSHSKFGNYMIVNESVHFKLRATEGTNLTLVLTISGTQFKHEPFISKNATTDGIEYYKNVTFNSSKNEHVSFVIFNKVSRVSKGFPITVRIRVLGLQASLTYTDGFIYQNGLTYFNTSFTQGDYVAYYWVFEGIGYNTKSPTVTRIFKTTGKTNVTIYGHNSASYMQRQILARVIPNPVTLTIGDYVEYMEAGALANVSCSFVWPGGTSEQFFKQYNLTGKKGTDPPERHEWIVEFGDGQNITTNASEFPVKHRFARNLKPGYNVKCTLKTRPELNIWRNILAIDKIIGLKITTNCPSTITIGNTTCTLQVVVTKGDKMSCSWTIKDGSVTLFLFSCSVSHKFKNGYPASVLVKASNPLSWLKANKTFAMATTTTLFPQTPTPTSSSISSKVATTPTASTTEGTSKQTSTPSIPNTVSKQTSTATNTKSFPISSSSSTIEPTSKETSTPSISNTVSKQTSPVTTTTSLSISPSSSRPTIPTTSTLPPIKDAVLVCPGNGIVNQEMYLKVSTSAQHKSIHLVWTVGNVSFITSNRSIVHVFRHPGIFRVKCTVTNGQEKVLLGCQVPVQYRIEGFKIKTLEVVKEMLIAVQFEILQGTNVTYRVDYGDEGTSQGFITNFPSQTKLQHQYSKPSEYIVRISVSSIAGSNTSLSRNIIVKSVQQKCKIVEVILEGASQDNLSAPTILPQNDYLISSSLKAHCESKILFTWEVFSIVNETFLMKYKLPEDVEVHGRELVLPSNTLSSGLYRIALTVISEQHNVSQTKKGFLRVHTPSLIALIECGSSQTLSRDSNVILNASLSYNPANPAAGSSVLVFEWFCQGKTDAWFGSVVRNSSVLRLPRGWLKEDEYVFTVRVTAKEGGRKENASQTIKVVSFDVPVLCISCIDNCGSKVLLKKPIILSVKDSPANTTNVTVDYNWKIDLSRHHHVTRRAVVTEDKKFVISPTDLQPNQTYVVSLEAEVNKTMIKSGYSFRTDDVPVGGRCEINPPSGKVIETSFQIKCSNWEDQDSPLWYEYFYNDVSSGSLLMAYGWQSYSPPLYLPPGDPSSNFTLNVRVDIVDTLGSRRQVPLTVQVTGFSASDGPVSTILNGYIQGPTSKLGQILLSGEQQQAFQLMTTISTVLNDDSSNGSPSGHSKREKVRLVLTKEFSGGCCSSLPSLRQVLGGLQGATKVPKEITPDSQINGANGYQKMAQSLATKYHQASIDSESTGIVNGLSDILEASEMTSTNAIENTKTVIDWLDDSNSKGNTEILQKSNTAANQCLSGADQIARALVSRKKTGDEPTALKSSKIEVAAHREKPSNMKGKRLDKTETKFVMPIDGLGEQLDNHGYVDSKIVTLKQSPFLTTDTTTPIASQVSSLELQDPTGKIIPIENLAKPITIYLQNNATGHRTINDVIESCDNDLSVYKTSILEPNATVRLQVNCSSTCSVFWKKAKRPTKSIYNLRWNLTKSIRFLERLLDWRDLNGTGDYYLGISRGINTSNVSCDTMEPLVYNISIHVISCMYWNEGNKRWSTHGCQVGPETNQHQIQCLCTHLTWFGGKLFIPPNKIDIKKIAAMITEPRNFAAVLSVLCIIWGLYAVAVVWARREDRKDELKAKVCISPSNRPDTEYIYEVTVTTGIRRSAGTTANTAIIMYGEDQDSDPFLLTDIDTNRPLQRGVSHTFLLTTRESLGHLLHVRVWHDNEGKDPALFIKQVSVRDIQTKKVFHFLCNRWFAVDEGDGLIDRVLPLTSEEEMTQFTQMFLSKTQKDLTDSHLWFSIVWRPPHSVFTRVQRVSCCLSLLLCTMMANAMWYKTDEGRYTRVDLGPVEFSWEQVSIGIMSSLIVFPINLILVQIFRHSKLKKPIKIPKSSSLGNNKVEPNEKVVNSERYSRLRASSVKIDFNNDQESPKHRSFLDAAQVVAAAFVWPERILPDSNSENADKNRLIKSDENLPSSKKKYKFRGLPYWCRYIGWCGVIITALVSTTVTLLYGIQFGKRTSEQWLLSMFISVTQDIFVSQPLKVVLLAVVFAFLIKKPQLNEKPIHEDERQRREWLERCASPRHPSLAMQAPPSKPSDDTLKMARKRREQEKQMGVILKDIISYLVFLVTMLLIAYGFRDKSSFLQKESIEGLLLRGNYSGLDNGYIPNRFHEAHKVGDMWTWLDNLVLPVLYNLPWYFYAGKPTTYVDGGSGMVVGVARLRQLRITEGDCTVAEDVRPIINKCRSSYSTDIEDNTNYGSQWTPLNSSIPIDHTSPWTYNTAIQLTGFPFMGNAETYSGGGYVLTMSHVYYKALKQIRQARKELWTDVFTRAIFVEFNLYNPSSNLFTACTVLMEVLPTGGFILKHEFLTYRLYRYVGDFQIFILAMEVLFLLFILYFTYREGKSFYQKRKAYFKDSWNWIEVIIIILSWISIAHYFICFGIRKWTLQKYLDNREGFTNFHYISAWQVVFENFIALTVFASFFKLIKLLKFNKRMYLFSHTLRRAARDVFNYCFIFLVVFLAFSQLYYFMLGNEYQSFSTIVRAMEKLISVLLGKFNFDEFMNPFRTLGAISFIVYMLLMKFFLLNILIVLVIESFQEVKHSNKKLANDFEMVDFVVEQFKSIIGIRTLRKKDENEEQTEERKEPQKNKYNENRKMNANQKHIQKGRNGGKKEQQKKMKENKENTSDITQSKNEPKRDSDKLEDLLFRINKLEILFEYQLHSETFDEVVSTYIDIQIEKILVSDHADSSKMFFSKPKKS